MTLGVTGQVSCGPERINISTLFKGCNPLVLHSVWNCTHSNPSFSWHGGKKGRAGRRGLCRTKGESHGEKVWVDIGWGGGGGGGGVDTRKCSFEDVLVYFATLYLLTDGHSDPKIPPLSLPSAHPHPTLNLVRGGCLGITVSVCLHFFTCFHHSDYPWCGDAVDVRPHPRGCHPSVWISDPAERSRLVGPLTATSAKVRPSGRIQEHSGYTGCLRIWTVAQKILQSGCRYNQMRIWASDPRCLSVPVGSRVQNSVLYRNHEEQIYWCCLYKSKTSWIWLLFQLKNLYMLPSRFFFSHHFDWADFVFWINFQNDHKSVCGLNICSW